MKIFSVLLTILILASLLLLVWASANEKYFFESDLYVTDFEHIEFSAADGFDGLRAYINESGVRLGKIYMRMNSWNDSDHANILVEIPIMIDTELDSVTFTFDTRPVTTLLQYQATTYAVPIDFHQQSTGYGNVFSIKNLGFYGTGTSTYEFTLVKPSNTHRSPLAFSVDLSMHHPTFLLTKLNAHAFAYLQV